MKSLLSYSLLLCFLGAVFTVKAQDNRMTLKGNIKAITNEIQDVSVQNITSGKGTISDGYGFFSIAVALNDTLIFSAIQFKKKTIIVEASILQSKSIIVPMEEAENQLNEVIVMPYNLTGDLTKDLKTEKVVVAATLGLPNAYVVKMTQSQRLLAEADGGGWLGPVNGGLGGVGGSLNLHKILNRISGRTKMLKERVAFDDKNIIIEELVNFFSDTIMTQELKIPTIRINEFAYFCEADINFSALIQSNDQLKLWEFLKRKSLTFRKVNDLD